MSQDVISIKGTRNGLVIRVDAGADFEEIKAGLLARMQAAKGFFQGARFLLHWNSTAVDRHQREELERICRQYGMVPGNEQEMLAFAPASRSLNNTSCTATTLFHAATVRNGQEITAAGNVVVVGDVNPGGQVRAGGSAIVAGTIKGSVAAGVDGNQAALVVAYGLRPLSLSIAGCPADLPLVDMVTAEAPFVAYLQNGQIIIGSYDNTLDRHPYSKRASRRIS